MWDNFEELMIKSNPCNFIDEYQLCKWLFNYGYENGETIVFDNDKSNYLSLDAQIYQECNSTFTIKKNTPIYNVYNDYMGDN